MATLQQFRFLDLPKELRLMVYDLLTTVTTAHTNRPYSLTIITKHKSAIALLSTCRQIYFEAKILHRQDAELNEREIRLNVHWTALNSPLTCTLLACLSRDLRTCRGLIDVEKILAEAGGVFDEQEISTHEHIHNLLHFSDRGPGKRTIDIAIDCDKYMSSDRLQKMAVMFRSWLRGMETNNRGTVPMLMVIRLRAVSSLAEDVLGGKVRNDYRPLRQLGHHSKWVWKWNGWVENDEWKESWVNGTDL